MNRFKRYLVFPTCGVDIDKCGMCTKLKIRSDMAKKYLELGLDDDFDFYKECEELWQQSSVYKKVKFLVDNGMTIDEAEVVLAKQGIKI